MKLIRRPEEQKDAGDNYAWFNLLATLGKMGIMKAKMGASLRFDSTLQIVYFDEEDTKEDFEWGRY